MTSIITHTAVPLAIASAAGQRNVPKPLLATGVAASLTPDLDIVGTQFGLPFEHVLGHRGFTHSPLFALLVAFLSLLVWRRLGPSRFGVFSFVLLSILSHGLLDAINHGGIGVAFLSPFSNERFLLPWRPIPAAPIELSRIFAPETVAVVFLEITWIWMPCLMVGLLFRWLRSFKPKPAEGSTGRRRHKYFDPASAWEAREMRRLQRRIVSVS